MEEIPGPNSNHFLRRNARVIGGFVVAGLLATSAFVWWHAHPGGGEGTTASRHVARDAQGLLAGQWRYLPGAEPQADGLHITHTGLAIVEQDGSGGQPNPPVNEYGTRLDVAGSFAVEATVTDAAGPADLQLYGDVPVIQDEFRVEPPSVRMELAGGALKVSVWDGRATQNLADQRPIEQRSFPVEAGVSVDLRMVREHGKLDFSVDGKEVGTVAEHDIFRAGRLWFGMDAPAADGHWRLSHLEANPVDDGKVQAVDTSRTSPIARDTKGLQVLAGKKRPGFLVGSAMALGPAVSDSKYANIAFGGNFGQMTTENALKFQFRHPEPNVYNFKEADALVALAQKHGLKVHGHALVFGEANPRWITDLPTDTQAQKGYVRKVMVDDIKTTVTHFKGKIASWDVVNEPMADYDDTPDGEGATLRNHKWYRAMGADYIALAFRTAHAADPKAQLYINEYGLESDGDRWDAFLTLMAQLKRQGVPITGVGFQSHVYEAEDQIDPAVLRRHIRQLAALGLKSRISEMDVYTDDGTAVQVTQYANVLAACLAEPSCVSFTTWGFDDDYDMWQEDDHSLQRGQDLLWTTGAKPTPALARLRQLLQT